MHGIRATPLLDSAATATAPASAATAGLWGRSNHRTSSESSASNSSATPDSPDDLQKLYDSVCDDSYQSNGNLPSISNGLLQQQQRSAYGVRPIGE